MIEALGYPFMQRALVGGALVGFLLGYFGTFVVQRRLAFMGSGLAHAAFGGVALGILLNTQPLWVAVPFTVIAAVGIVAVRERTQLAEDTAIGVFFAVSMAMGIVFLSLTKGYTGDAFAVLYGSILSVTTTDIVVTAVVSLLTIATIPMWSVWAYATFDRDLARSDRLPVVIADYVLSVAVAVAVVVAIKVVGILLIAAFLVLPPAAARLVSGTFRAMTLWSVALGISSAVAGLMISYATNLPSGATIILLQAVIFLGAMGTNRIARTA
jgi:zinc transport system permease protein